jgi:hypothetical protein
VFLLCWEHDPCSLYLDVMIMGMGIFIGCTYGSHIGIAVATLDDVFILQIAIKHEKKKNYN